MLFISGQYQNFLTFLHILVSISQSRCFSFQEPQIRLHNAYPTYVFQSRNRDAFHFRSQVRKRCLLSFLVSISQSRCFSFQAKPTAVFRSWSELFQSRNRDAFHFRSSSALTNPLPLSTFQSRNRDAFHFRHPKVFALARLSLFVSISQSRCFSFQEPRRRA